MKAAVAFTKDPEDSFVDSSEENLHRIHDHGEIQIGVVAGAKGSPVQDAENRDRIAVLDATREVAFTGYRDDRLRPFLHHNPSSQGPARGNKHGHPVFFPEGHEVLYLAFSAGLAVFNVAGNSNRAAVILKALGKQDKQFFRSHLSSLCKDKLIVDDHKGPPDLFLADTKESSHAHKNREEESNGHPSDFAVEEEILPPQDCEDKGQTTPQGKEYECAEQDCDNEGKFRVNVGKPYVGYPPKYESDNHKGDAGEEQEQEKGPLFRLEVIGLSHFYPFARNAPAFFVWPPAFVYPNVLSVKPLFDSCLAHSLARLVRGIVTIGFEWQPSTIDRKHASESQPWLEGPMIFIFSQNYKLKLISFFNGLYIL